LERDAARDEQSASRASRNAGSDRRRRRDHQREIADLTALKGELEGMIRQCGRGAVRDCRIIETLSPAEVRPSARTRTPP